MTRRKFLGTAAAFAIPESTIARVKEKNRSVAINVSLDLPWKPTKVFRLQAPSLESLDGVTFAAVSPSEQAELFQLPPASTAVVRFH